VSVCNLGRWPEILKEAHTACGLRLCAEADPNIVLMDINLRGSIDGIETALLVKERFRIPIIFITGNTDEHTERLARQLNPLGYWRKPIAAEMLCDNIHKAVISA